MTKIGAFLAIIGFGSLLLGLMNRSLLILAWADPMQPWLGIALGVVGVIVLVLGVLQERKAEQGTAQQQ